MIAQELRRVQIRLAERPNFFHHLHPPTIPTRQARLRYTLGAGGLALFLCLVLLVTGILEMFYYIPTPEHAGVSVEVITSLVPFGGLIRNLHFWAAQALMIVMSIHLLRDLPDRSLCTPSPAKLPGRPGNAGPHHAAGLHRLRSALG